MSIKLNEQLDNLAENAVAKEQTVLDRIEKLKVEATSQGGVIAGETAEYYVRRWSKKQFAEGNLNAKGETFEEYMRRKIDKVPAIIGLKKGGEADGVDKTELQKIRSGNKTAMSQQVAAHGLPRMNHIARSEGFKDIFDMASGRQPVAPAAAGADSNKPAARNSSGELSPWSPQGWNVTKQAVMFRDDPTKARAEMQKWNAKLGQTKPTRA